MNLRQRAGAVTLALASGAIASAPLFSGEERKQVPHEHKHAAEGQNHSADGHNDAAHAGEGKLPRPILSTHELMELFNEPLYEHLQQATGQKPADRQGWARLGELASRGAEIMNLVAIREDHAEHRDRWLQLTREAQETARNLAQAAQLQDWQAATAAHRALVQNCNDCHRTMAPDHAPLLDLPPSSPY